MNVRLIINLIVGHSFLETMLYKVLKHLWWIVAVISAVLIFILKFTEWRLITCSFADAGNYVVETLAFSMLAASLFYVINEFIPQMPVKNVAHRYIQRNLRRIRENLRIIVELVEPFRFDKPKYDLQSFTKVFREKDMISGYGNSTSFTDFINMRKTEIESICDDLLSSYKQYMSVEEIKYVDTILNSYFIQNSLLPMNFSVPEEDRYAYPNNQEEIGKSIFELYSLCSPIQ